MLPHTYKFNNSSIIILWIIVASVGLSWYAVYSAREILLSYESLDSQLRNIYDRQTTKFLFSNLDRPLYIPDLSLLTLNQPWMYVSRTAPLPSHYLPADLVDVTLPHAASDSPVRLQSRAHQKLTELFAKAKEDGQIFMIASAYRSVTEQQKLYDDFVAKRGEAAAKQYVAQPGTSEHHTGLAVDVDDASPACERDADTCELSYQSIAWLAEHAPDYGFIIRFPSTKQPVTGTAYEPWHLRYVGIVLAKQLTTSGLAFDEFIEQVAPGRVRNPN
ncbi:MAG: M15 family metallopeptidase [Candidatus Saccharimonadales bacterium]